MASLLQNINRSEGLERLLRVQSYAVPFIASGRQTWPEAPASTNPVGLPVEKEAIRLQVQNFIKQCHWVQNLLLQPFSWAFSHL